MVKVALLMTSTALMLLGYSSIRTNTFYFGRQQATTYSARLKILATLVGVCELAIGLYVVKNYVF
jgi:hypothetical protein